MSRDWDESPEDQGHSGSVEEAGVWIRDALGRRTGGFYHLGYSSAIPGSWRDAAELENPSHMEEFRLVAEGLRAHGRGDDGLVVLVTDDQGSGRARSFLAFQIARLLGEGGSRVLLVDGEFAEDGPGEWLGEPGREGLLDIGRYGASPRACAQRLVLPNTQLMGLGSFRPGEDEALNEEELQASLRQLRSGWDFVLCTAPAYYADGSFNPLFDLGDGVLMGVTLKGEARDRFESLADYLLEQGVNVFGVMAFSEPGEVAEPEVEEMPPLVLEEERPSRGVSPYADLPRSSPHQSSGVFRTVAVSIIIALAVFVGLWFGIQYLQRPEQVEFPPLALEAGGAIEEEPVDSGELQLAGDTPVQSSAVPSESADEGEGPGAEPKPAETAVQNEEIPPAETQESGTVGAGDGRASQDLATVRRSGAIEPRQPTTEEPEPLPEPAAVVPETRASAPTPATDPLERALRLRPSSGYALHLWSFPDSMQALPSVRKLEAEGYRPLVAAAEVKGKGIWYRVLVGNYATRSEALAARELLSDRSDIDYVGVLKVGG